MSVQAVLLPVFVLVALTFALLVLLGRARGRALRGGKVRAEELALDGRAWGEQSIKVNAAYENVLAMPVLFYALVAFALITRKADLLFVIMEWIYVAARFVQAGIHTTHNNIRRRGAAFGVSVLVLLVMWVIFAMRIVTAGV